MLLIDNTKIANIPNTIDQKKKISKPFVHPSWDNRESSPATLSFFVQWAVKIPSEEEFNEKSVNPTGAPSVRLKIVPPE